MSDDDIKRVCSNLDWLATFLDACHAEKPPYNSLREAKSLIERQAAENDRLRMALRGLLEEEGSVECSLDDGDYCEAHLSPAPCVVAAAYKALKEGGQ